MPPTLPLAAPQLALSGPWPLAQLLSRSFGQPPAFRLLRQELRSRAGAKRLLRLSSYQLGEVPLSWHLACLDLHRLPAAAAELLAAGGNLGQVMALWGLRREQLRVSFCRAAGWLPRPLARMVADAFSGPFWLRFFRVVGEGELGVVWEALPARGDDAHRVAR